MFVDSLRSRAVLVTGAGGGVGLALAGQLAAAGWTVIDAGRYRGGEGLAGLVGQCPVGGVLPGEMAVQVFGRDITRARRLGARLQAGTVNINDGFTAAYGSLDAPLGGMGISGLGRRHGAEGLLKYTEVRSRLR
jgi:NAD(P)-dependent dehydrogenase (short-subunit alcohol dehydrogenase family)